MLIMQAVTILMVCFQLAMDKIMVKKFYLFKMFFYVFFSGQGFTIPVLYSQLYSSKFLVGAID